MDVEYGFFNSTMDDPRYYDAEDVNEFFKGLISSTGIFNNIGNMLQVKAYDPARMAVKIDTGKAMIDHHWVKVTDVIDNVTIDPSDPLETRYDAVVMRYSKEGRRIFPYVITGSAGGSYPAIARDDQNWDLLLAYIIVQAGATVITGGNIIDVRLTDHNAGLITGLIQQVDTSTLYSGLVDWCEEQKRAMTSWENAMQTQFDSWLETLTSQLLVQTYIEKFHLFREDPTEIISFNDIQGYTYDSSDIFFVNINGLLGVQNRDYTVYHDGNESGIYLINGRTSATGLPCKVDITILKSRIGFNTLVDSNSNQIVTNDNDNISLGG